MQSDKIEAQFIAPMNDLLQDVLEVAAAVFFADTNFRRGGDSRPDMGAGWRRQFDFHLAVRHPEVWARSEVSEALRDAVEFLTGDSVCFTFQRKESNANPEPYLPFGMADDTYAADEVILFSGGLDSFAGALDALTSRLGHVVLVTHRSAQKAIPRQMELARVLKNKFGGRILHVNVRATRSREPSNDSTQRSRSFLFASLGYVVARMSGASCLSFYENGVVSQNLPISPQVIETMASRTTHPLALLKLQSFFDTLDSQQVEIRNPFMWLTKTDVVRKIQDLNGERAIASSVSCTKSRSEARDVHHCGTCSQCLDRRFAILAAGLEDYDPVSDYKIDVLHGARKGARGDVLAVDWTQHALHLASTGVMEFAKRFINDLMRIAEACPTEPGPKVIERCFDLQQRHGRAVRDVMRRELGRRADTIVRSDPPQRSLMTMVVASELSQVGGLGDGLTAVPSLVAEIRSAEPPIDPGNSLFPLRVAFFQEKRGPAVEVEGLGCVRHAPAAIAHDLKPIYDEDIHEGLAPENHRYVPRADLTKIGRSIEKNSVSQLVKRCRRQLAEFYVAIEQKTPPRDLLIENVRNKGYRLDPTIRVIRRDQMRQKAKD